MLSDLTVKHGTLLTEACKSGTKVPKDRGLGIASFPLYGQLGFHVDLADPRTQDGNKNSGSEEDGRHQYYNAELHDHLERQLSDDAKPSGHRTVHYNVALGPCLVGQRLMTCHLEYLASLER